MKQALGKVATGDDFFNRQDEVKEFIEYIKSGTNLKILAQRRMGKTSLLREVSRRLENDYNCVFVDFQEDDSPAAAIARISLELKQHQHIWDKTKNLFGSILDHVEKLSIDEIEIKLRAGLDNTNWSSKGDRLFEILNSLEKPTLLMFDEITIMINRMLKGNDFQITPERKETTSQFMSWLRRNSLKYQSNISIVLSGSIGLEPVLRQAGLTSTINHFHAFELGPWSSETTTDFVESMASEYKIRIERNVPAKMIELLGYCIPHHVQVFFDFIRRQYISNSEKCLTVQDIENVYYQSLLSTRGYAELTHYEKRLEEIIGPELLPLAIDMLSEAALEGYLTNQVIKAMQAGFSFNHISVIDAQKDILLVLEHDGYLEYSDKGYHFVSKLLREWWKRRNEAFYTPISKRGNA